MPDFTTEFSFAILLDGDEQREWATRAVAYIESVHDEEHDPAATDEFFAVLPEDPEFNRFGIEVDDDGLWLHSEEGGDPAHVIPLVQAYLAKFDPQGYVGIEWANTCSRPVLDAFGGGAVFVTANGSHWMTSSQWLTEQMKEHDDAHR